MARVLPAAPAAGKEAGRRAPALPPPRAVPEGEPAEPGPAVYGESQDTMGCSG